MVDQRKKLTSRERIAIHRSRFGGCGVFKKANEEDIFDMAGGEVTIEPVDSGELDNQ